MTDYTREEKLMEVLTEAGDGLLRCICGHTAAAHRAIVADGGQRHEGHCLHCGSDCQKYVPATLPSASA